MASEDPTCPPGTFGLECERQCNCVSEEQTCLASTGGCPSGCAPGYTGEDCWTPCSAGTYGGECLEQCNLHCSGANNDCDHVTGSCSVSCDLGYTPFPQCSLECPSGTFGQECGETCSTRCLDSLCDHVTGVCDQCRPGLGGILCDEECSKGYHGPGCSIPCNKFCSGPDNDCAPVDGSCKVACDAGYYPFPFCTDKCPVTTYGVGCRENCSARCLNRNCHHVTGECIQCAAGHTGQSCDEDCPPGKHGPECLERCSSTCAGQDKPCNHITGLCDLGCVNGFEPSTGCTEVCRKGTYGLNCRNTCNTRCLSNHCDHVTGACKGCTPGYTGEFCDQECPQQTFGVNCTKSCSANCLDNVCDHVTGICQGCTQGKMGDHCAMPYNESGSESYSTTTTIGIAVGTGAVLLVLVVVLVVILLRGRRKHKPRDARPVLAQRSKNRDSELTNESPETSKVVYQAEKKGDRNSCSQQTEGSSNVGKVNLPPCNTAVKVEDLKAFLLEHANDSFLKDQFQSISMANSSTQSQGQSTRNQKKNRYKNIVPYDHSRVLLQTDAQRKYEDYFNASYVKGYKSDQTFIASQAPTDHILTDFVRMLWEQNVDRIVMLTNLVEMSKIKCTQYWPKEGDIQYGEITVRLLTTIVFAEYTIRRLRFSKTGESARDVTQFHFTAWPDKSVPDSPWGLVDFYNRVADTQGTGPLLVHCSAGVGRTGTFIALCHLLQAAEETGTMDFLSTLWRLRQDRMSMIQTMDQYVFLHRAALVGYVTAGTSIQIKDISKRCSALLDTDEILSTGFQKEFEALALACDVIATVSSPSNDEAEGDSANNSTIVNREKNRTSRILAKEAHRPKLKSGHKKDNSYINAVLVPSQVKTRQDILTQLPLPATVTDFWRLVTQYRVGLIVAFETEKNHTDESIGRFLPDKDAGPLEDAVFEVKAKVEADTRLCQSVSVTVQKRSKKHGHHQASSGDLHCVTCLVCKRTNLDPESTLDLLKKVKACKRIQTPRTIYMCRNGADHCGLMCVQSILLDRLETDQCLAVPLVVGAVRAIRPQVIPTVEQYKSLYDVLRLAHETRDVYSYVKDVKSATASDTKHSVPESTTEPVNELPHDDRTVSTGETKTSGISFDAEGGLPGGLKSQINYSRLKEDATTPKILSDMVDIKPAHDSEEISTDHLAANCEYLVCNETRAVSSDMAESQNIDNITGQNMADQLAIVSEVTSCEITSTEDTELNMTSAMPTENSNSPLVSRASSPDSISEERYLDSVV